MDVNIKITVIASIFAFSGFLMVGMANDSDAGDKAKNLGYFIIGLGLAVIVIMLMAENPEEIKAVGHRVVAFCGF